MEKIIKEYSKDDITVVWQPDKCIHSAECVKGLPKAFNPKAQPWINLDHVSTAEIIEQVHKCPSGALKIKNRNKINEENMTEQSNTEITIFKNGPIMIKGSLSIKHKDGKEEAHEEVYLCRCGQSENKPFCDGAHKKCGFKDE